MYEAGDKFVIEIGEAYIYCGFRETEEQKNMPARLYRIKGFKSLVFDENGLKKLKPVGSEETTEANAGYSKGWSDGYDNGLADMWEFIEKVNKNSVQTNEEIFGSAHISGAIQKITPQKAIEKLKAWEEKQEIKVGDVVEYGTNSVLLIVTHIYSDGEFDGMKADGANFSGRKLSACKKTGKHIDLTEIFKGLEEENV